MAVVADHEGLLFPSSSSGDAAPAEINNDIATDISRLESLYGELSDSLRAAVVTVFGGSGDAESSGSSSLHISTARSLIEVK